MPATCHRGQSIRALCLALIYVREETEIQRKLKTTKVIRLFLRFIFYVHVSVCLVCVHSCACMCVHMETRRA